MTNRKTFPMGGIHPDKHKITTDKEIVFAGLPEVVYIPVKQHIGSPAKITVQKGDKVKVGTLLADADGIVSADVFSSVSGEVIKVEEVEGEFGYLENMITIQVERDEFEPSIDRSPNLIKDITLEPQQIVDKIRAAGIVGMGGAGYPTPVKTAIPTNKKIDTLILNGIECEPWLTADDRLMVEKAEEIIVGAKIINKVLGIQNAIIAIDENKPRAIEVLSKLTKTYIGVNVQVCKTKYPQGGEKQLIKAITNREVPSGKLPMEVGCVVQNVGTVFAIYEAVQKNKPLFERIVTVSGDECKNPQNFRVRVGTPASYLIEKCGGLTENTAQVIFGGPMMGTSAVNINAPITKLTSGILILSDKISHKTPETDCIRCGKCVDVCPIGLRPFLIAQYTRNNMVDELKTINVLDCIECGSCAYTCPAHIPLLDYCKVGKMEVKKTKK